MGVPGVVQLNADPSKVVSRQGHMIQGTTSNEKKVYRPAPAIT